MNTISLVLIILMALGFVFAFGVAPWRARRPWRKRILPIIASLLVVTGAVCFFAPAISALGGFDWLPSSVEWPVGNAKGVVQTSSGLYVVPHVPSNRIQIYDASWNYVRGWRTDAAGGNFVLRMTDEDRIEVFTARGPMHHVYDLNGNLLATRAAEESPKGSGASARVPTAWWLMPLVHPIAAWSLAAVGLLVLILSDRAQPSAKVSPTDSIPQNGSNE